MKEQSSFVLVVFVQEVRKVPAFSSLFLALTITGAWFLPELLSNYFIFRCVDLRTGAFDVPPQEILTRDSVTVSVDAVVYYQVSNPLAAVCNNDDYNRSTRLLAATTLRFVFLSPAPLVFTMHLEMFLAPRICQKFSLSVNQLVTQCTKYLKLPQTHGVFMLTVWS